MERLVGGKAAAKIGEGLVKHPAPPGVLRKWYRPSWSGRVDSPLRAELAK